MDIELKPCPFCGGKASNVITEDYPGSYIYFTKCDGCGMSNIEAMHTSHDESAAAWNTRTASERSDHDR